MQTQRNEAQCIAHWASLKMRSELTRVLATASELVLELLDAASRIDETLLASEGRVRIGSNIANHHLVINAIDCFRLAATHSGASQIFSASRNIDEGNRVELWMNISFHSKCPFGGFGLSLTRFKARVRLADDVNASLTTNYLAVRVTVFERFNRRYNFHNKKRENW